jgi:predicted Zn-dependent protease
MNKLFGKKAPENKGPDPKEQALKTLSNLSKTINEMEEKIEFVENKKNAQTEIAKQKLKAGDKNGAKQALAKKKKYDEQIKQWDGAIMMMQEQQMMLENMETLKNVFTTVDQTNQFIKESQKNMNMDKIDDIKNDFEVKLVYNTL